MRILLVDDSPGVRGRLAAMLREHPGNEVCEAADAGEAIAAVSARSFDVIVLDVHLPGASGLDVLSHLRASATDVTAIVLTNDPSETHRRESLLRGADHFLDKSRDFEEVVAIVRETAGRSGA